MNQSPESPGAVTFLGIPMLRDSIPTVQMVVATAALGLLLALSVAR